MEAATSGKVMAMAAIPGCNARPTLTVFPAEPSIANGTAVVICPGGAFFALSIDSEGLDVARWLNTRGVTGFVLKYRLVECKTDDPTRELMARGKLDDIVAPIVKLAIAGGNAAIGYVRKHAKEYGVNPDRIGILGFSADRKSTRLNSSHSQISYAVFCLKKKNK